VVATERNWPNNQGKNKCAC